MLAKANRFHGHNSLKVAYSSGETVRSKFISLKYKANPRRGQGRLAVVVAKKVTKKAPQRNRIRRRVYEVFRLHWPMIKPGYDMVVTIFDERVAEVDATRLNKTIVELLVEAQLLKQ